MSIGPLAAIPLVGDLAKVASEITQAVAPLIQPFADVLAKSLGNALEQKDKPVEFASAEATQKQPLTF